MVIVAVDDEKPARILLENTIRKVRPDAEIHVFSDPEDLLEFVKRKPADIALLDIWMYGAMDGVELAVQLKKLVCKINIIFVTAHERYMKAAMDLHASGYIQKPYTEDDLRRELSDLRHPLVMNEHALLKVNCFGNFEVFGRDNLPLHFERSKAKEVLAYLVHRHGSSCTIKEISATLFEDEPYDKKLQGYTQKIISSLVNTLKACGAGDVIHKTYNSISIRTELIDCDYYRFEQLDVAAIDLYMNEYMAQYSWAEFIPRLNLE